MGCIIAAILVQERWKQGEGDKTMIYRLYVEKQPGFAVEAAALHKELKEFLQVESLTGLRLLNRYDIEGIDAALFAACRDTVFAEPQTDRVWESLPQDADAVFAVEYLPGQFDQRADSCSQCIQFISGGQRPAVATAKVYLLYGALSEAELATVKKHLINPVECREAVLELPETLAQEHPVPPDVARLNGFGTMDAAGRQRMIQAYGLAMDADDLAFCQQYFQEEGRDPSLTELRMIDTYWSDHCRHTTFSTILTDAEIADSKVARAYQRYLRLREELAVKKPVCLMDMATIGAKYLKRQGLLLALDESEEVNACTVRIEADVDGKKEPWLLLFKNETHNHPTEIEPFGGAATCIGGAIRDPLSGRGYVYQAMRLTGAGDPTRPVEETLPGKLPQRRIVTAAAQGYASYGNQIGVATGLVDEVYHPGYIAKRMEVGAVIAAAPAENVRREQPAAGDLVLLLGGRTGRDGCGGATGSSKSHDSGSLTSCGAEVQKGNAPEERKLQRLFRHAEAARLIKRCNDFGAGGVSVAIGELAPGLEIDLDAVPKKYEGLDGTELAISESQERMAVVLAPQDLDAFRALAEAENLEATVVARVQAEPRLRMQWRGQTIVDLSREFLDSNGAPKEMKIAAAAPKTQASVQPPESFGALMRTLAGDLNICSRRGLAERFDSTVGAGSVLMPFGGKYQRTPLQVMAAKLPLASGETNTCSLMSYGFDPALSSADPYAGAYLAVVSSLAKLVSAGADLSQCWLSFQEYFPKPGQQPERWGLPFAALLGALSAQLDFGVAAIGGKDSMSGSFEQLDVPPTLISFAVAMGQADRIVSPEFKQAGNQVVLLRPSLDADGLPQPESQRQVFRQALRLLAEKKAVSAYAPAFGGVAAAVMKMCFGNGLGFAFAEGCDPAELSEPCYGAILLELAADVPSASPLLGRVTELPVISCGGEEVALEELSKIYEQRLEDVYPCCSVTQAEEPVTVRYGERGLLAPRVGHAKPHVLIPAFPGTNCEYDTARAFARAGADPEILVIRNLTPQAIAESLQAVAAALERSQILAFPGGFSGGDEPDGSGKFITAFFRDARLVEAVSALLEQRDGLVLGICNGFQALIKLGLVPFGRIMPPSAAAPTLTYNTIGRHQSKLVRVRVSSLRSPWLMHYHLDEVETVAISHGEGRFICSPELFTQLALNGQIAEQYVDLDGKPSMDIQYNPNGSYMAVEAITSPDGRVFGRMGHPERAGSGLLRNVPGETQTRLFRGAVDYFRQ